jgi:hypothetical protein
VVSFGLSTIFLVLALLIGRSPGYVKFALFAYVPVGILGTVIVSVLREDRGLTREERMARIVPYAPSVTLMAQGWVRQHRVLAWIVVVVLGIGAVRTSAVIIGQGVTLGRVVWLTLEVMLVALLASGLIGPPAADDVPEEHPSEDD